MVYSLKIPLDNHQLVGADYCLKNKYVCVGDAPGIGKTAQALAVATTVKDSKTLAVVPAGLRKNWEHETKKFTYLRPLIIKSEKDIKKAKDYNVLIISYQFLSKKKAKNLFMMSDLVIADEAHALKNIKAARTKNFDNYLFDAAPSFCLLLTGTPIENRVPEFYNMLVMLGYNPNPGAPDSVLDHYPSQYKFNKHFCKSRSFEVNGRRVTKWFGLQKGRKRDLKKLLSGKYYRRTQTDTALPELRDKEVYIDYKKDPILENEWELFVENSSMTSTMKAQSALNKAPFTVDYVHELHEQGEGPVVVYTDHLDSFEALVAGFKKKKLKVDGIRGGMGIDLKDEIVQKFQAKKLDVLVITSAAREGLNLFAAAHLVFNDIPWIPGWIKQIKKRIHRMGQTRDCLVHYIYGSYQDAHIKKNVEEKQRVLEEIL